MTLALRWVAIGALAAAGCAASLREPPPVETLQRDGAQGRAPQELLSEAATEYARRPDPAAVRRAEGLCLAAAQADERAAAGLVCAVQAKAWLVEHERDGGARTDLAVSAVQAGQWCLRREPASAPCKFWLAAALGLQARERPVTAEDGLKRMVEYLRQVARDAPDFEHAGADRVLALVLLRAPPWPLGPGDPEEALVRARAAVAREGDYPPNLLALGKALAENGDGAGASAAFARALETAGARQWRDDPDATSWVAEARAGLGR